jgi:hypothetical protein
LALDGTWASLCSFQYRYQPLEQTWPWLAYLLIACPRQRPFCWYGW